jgi:hypothetical protein
MKTKQLLLTVVLASASLQPSALVCAAPLGSAFPYQGRLADGTNAASGTYDLTFTLYDDASGGTAVAGPIRNGRACHSVRAVAGTRENGAQRTDAPCLCRHVASALFHPSAFIILPLRERAELLD